MDARGRNGGGSPARSRGFSVTAPAGSGIRGQARDLHPPGRGPFRPRAGARLQPREGALAYVLTLILAAFTVIQPGVILPGADDADLMNTAYLFVPPACEDGAERCGLHLVLHGCAQSAEVVGTDFIEQSGYLPWAEANGIVLAFPQVEKSLMAPMNPHGCWDWWGYTGDDYARRSGKQMAVVADWIGSLAE